MHVPPTWGLETRAFDKGKYRVPYSCMHSYLMQAVGQINKADLPGFSWRQLSMWGVIGRGAFESDRTTFQTPIETFGQH